MQFESRLTPAAGGAAMTHTGSYVAVWRLEPDSAWRIELYIDRSQIEG